MRTALRNSLAALVVGAVVAVPVSVASAGDDRRSGGGQGNGQGNGQGRALDAVGLVAGTSLVSVRTSDGRVRDQRPVTGLTGDRRLVGIDHRVQDGLLYGVGDAGGVYTLARDGRATEVTRLTVPLAGTSFGVDFNPAANALRVVSDTGQNLRQPFATPGAPTVADGPLAYTPGTPAAGITAAGYTNNDLDPATATTLFDLDTTLDQVAVQSPANAGSLAPTGRTGVDAVGDAGLDVYSTVRDGSTVDLTAFAVLTVDGDPGLYSIALLTGRATLLGDLDRPLTDIAVPLAQR